MFIKNLFSDRGSVSSKRFIAIIGSLVLFSIIVYSVGSGKAIDHHIYDGLIVVVLGAAGITAFEKVQGIKSGLDEVIENTPEKTEQP